MATKAKTTPIPAETEEPETVAAVSTVSRVKKSSKVTEQVGGMTVTTEVHVSATAETTEPEQVTKQVTLEPMFSSVTKFIDHYVASHGEGATLSGVFDELKKKKMHAAEATVHTQFSQARKRHGIISARAEGPVAKIVKLFAEGNGITSAAAMISYFHENQIEGSDATIRTQVQRLRKQYNLTAEGPGRGLRSPNGPLATIAKLFAEGRGVVTVEDMKEKLEELGVKTAEATIRTQIGRLRKKYNLVKNTTVTIPTI